MRWNNTLSNLFFVGDESLMLRHFQMLLECSGQILIPWYIIPSWMVDFYGKCRLKYTMHGWYGIFHQLLFSRNSRSPISLPIFLFPTWGKKGRVMSMLHQWDHINSKATLNDFARIPWEDTPNLFGRDSLYNLHHVGWPTGGLVP